VKCVHIYFYECANNHSNSTGLKEKAGAVAGQLGPVAGKLQGAKDMIGAQTAHLAESGMGQMAKANLAKLSDQASGVTSYISEYNFPFNKLQFKLYSL
jgi:hypothetical protein